MAIELGPQVLDSSTRISNLICAPTDSEHKFNKAGIEKLLPIGFNPGLPSLETRSHNHYTMFNR